MRLLALLAALIISAFLVSAPMPKGKETLFLPTKVRAKRVMVSNVRVEFPTNSGQRESGVNSLSQEMH